MVTVNFVHINTYSPPLQPNCLQLSFLLVLLSSKDSKSLFGGCDLPHLVHQLLPEPIPVSEGFPTGLFFGVVEHEPSQSSHQAVMSAFLLDTYSALSSSRLLPTASLEQPQWWGPRCLRWWLAWQLALCHSLPFTFPLFQNRFVRLLWPVTKIVHAFMPVGI